jgi:DUF1016 N-terminal domain
VLFFAFAARMPHPWLARFSSLYSVPFLLAIPAFPPLSGPSPGYQMSREPHPGAEFAEVVQMIVSARRRTFQAVNTALIELYWQVGAYISHKIRATEWGDGVVRQLAEHLAHAEPGLRGFTSRNLFRMRAFYEAYCAHELVTPLVSLSEAP